MRQDERSHDLVEVVIHYGMYWYVVEEEEGRRMTQGENVLQLSHQFTISRGIVGHLARWTLSIDN
jgi:hypothetical protein